MSFGLFFFSLWGVGWDRGTPSATLETSLAIGCDMKSIYISFAANLFSGLPVNVFLLVQNFLFTFTVRAWRRRGSMTLLRTFLMVLVLVTTSSCYRSMNAGMKMTMILAGAKIMTCRYPTYLPIEKACI